MNQRQKQKQLDIPEQDPVFNNLINRNRKKTQNINEVSNKCPHCNYHGNMNIVNSNGCAAISWAVCLTLFTGVLFFVPLFLKTCKDKVTLCPQCSQQIERQYADCF